MTHPTDDELEATAARLEDGRVCSPAQNSCRNGYWMLEAAAMLRACKGRAVKPLPRGDGEGGWTLPVELLAEIRDEVYANEWDAPCAEVIEIIALSAETRVLSAREPAPDQKERQAYIQGTQAGWNAAIEAAANVADVKPRKGGKPLSSPHHQGVRDGRAVVARLIRNLKKGQTND